jgi:hypothetical protein
VSFCGSTSISSIIGSYSLTMVVLVDSLMGDGTAFTLLSLILGITKEIMYQVLEVLDMEC